MSLKIAFDQTLDFETRIFLEKINQQEEIPLTEDSLKDLQKLLQENNLVKLTTTKEILDITINGPYGPIKNRLYYPNLEKDLPVFIFLHGGGFTLGSLEDYDYFCQKIAFYGKCLVLAVEYHLAPAYPFPKPLEECFFITNWANQNISNFRGNPKAISIGGDSAGGNLATAVTLIARELKSFTLKSQVLIYPTLDCNFNTASYRKFAKGYYLTKANMQFFWKQYITTKEEFENPYACPLKAKSFKNLPKTLMILAEFDPLYEEGRAYVTKLEQAGNHVTLQSYPTIHAFIHFEKELSLAEKAMELIGNYLKNYSVSAFT